MRKSLIREIHRLKVNGVKFKIKELGTLLAHVKLCSCLLDQIKITQKENPQICKIIEEVRKGKVDKLNWMAMMSFGIKIACVSLMINN